MKNLGLLAVFSIISLWCSPVLAGDGRLRGVQLPAELKTEDLPVLALWKANLVRYSLLWEDVDAADSSTAASYQAWLDESLNRFDALIPYFEQYGIRVALCLYTPPGAFANRGTSSTTHRIFTEPWAQTAFISAWEQIAQRYKNSSVIWAFDLVNEPAQRAAPAAPLKDWRTLAGETITAIRAIDPERQIVVSPIWGKPAKLKALGALPFENLVYTIHYYAAFNFLHQGVGRYPNGVYYPGSRYNRPYLIRILRPALRFRKQYGATIYVGEFVTNRWAPEGSGFRYLRDAVQLFEKYGMNWTYHVFRGASVWDLEAGEDKGNPSRLVKPTNRLRFMLKQFKKS